MGSDDQPRDEKGQWSSGGAGAWAKAKVGGNKRGDPHIVIEHLAGGGTRTTDHASKADAHRYGMQLRREGKTAFAHSAADAKKFGLDPRRKS